MKLIINNPLVFLAKFIYKTKFRKNKSVSVKSLAIQN